MQEEISSNQRIAKNTILLYGRMIVMTFIGLFTTRVILNALGVSDLGLMNVAGSVVGMFTFLNATMISGTQRFITYGIGEGNTEKLKKVFSSAMTLHLAIAVTITILCETVGLWYLYNHLNCEPGRFDAAMWCYQLSVCSMFISMLQIPFNSALVAHEHMGMYAYMSIYDAVAKLLAAYLIMIVPFDRLIFYSTLSFIISLIPTFIYNWYCRKHFTECAFRFGFDKPIFKDMLSFSGWNTIGCMADMGRGTGINLVLNAFYGTVVNGARGIAVQANNWVYKFVDSFMIAMRPQVTKSYAARDYNRMADLVCNGSCYGSYLYMFLGIPLFIEIEWVLGLWLGQCPEHTAAFLRIIMIQLLLQTMGHLTGIAMQATGKMKTVNLSVGIILLSILPIGYLFARLGYSSEVVLAVCVIPWTVVPFVRISLINKYSRGNFPILRYSLQVMLKTPLLGVVMFLPPFIVHELTNSIDGLVQFLLVGTTSVLTSLSVIYYLGLNKDIRAKALQKVQVIILQKLPITPKK